MEFFEFLLSEDEVLLKFGVDLVEFFECELKFLVLFGVSVKFIFEDFEIFAEPVDFIFAVHVLNFVISDDFVQLPFILFIGIDFVGEFFEFVFVLSLSFFLGGLEFFDLSVDSGDDFLLKFVFALDFGGVESQSLVGLLLVSVQVLKFGDSGCEFGQLLSFVLEVFFHERLFGGEFGVQF